MNKLQQWLRRVAGGEGPRMGFGAAAPAAKGPSLGLLAILPALSQESVSAALKAGAEALIVPPGLTSNQEDLPSVIKASPACLWGQQLGEGQAHEPEPGFDFLLLSPSSALSALKGEEQGRLLAIDPAWDDTQLRSLEPLPLDGVVFPLTALEEENLQIKHLLAVRRLAVRLRKPLILELDHPLSRDDLGMLRDGGISGLLVRGAVSSWLDTIKELRRAAEALPPKSRPRREVDVVLPFVTGGRAPQTEEEEEEET